MKVFYVDPQSYNNLADYDKFLLENIGIDKEYFCSVQLPFENVSYAKIHKIFKYNKYKGLKKILSYTISILKFFKKVKSEQPDVIHYQWFKIPLFDLLVFRRIRKENPNVFIVHTAHNVLPHDSGYKYFGIYKKIYENVDSIIVHAENTKKEIVELFGINSNKITVIPHGFLPRKKVDSFSKTFEGITFSFIGFLSEYKGLDLLINAWTKDNEIINNEKIRLLIAGAGDLDCLKAIPKGKNIIVENYFHSDEELTKIIYETDIAILPYKRISQSGVLLTYLAEHIPVIVSNIGGLTQPFELGKVGWVMDNLSSDSLKNILVNIITDNSNLNKIVHDSELWSKIDNYYDWKRIGKMTENLYQNLKR